MKKYIVISEKLEGNISFGYTENGFLCFFEVNAPNLTDDHIKWILDRIESAYYLERLQHWAKANGWKIEEVQIDMSFTAWYNYFNMKRNKIEAEKLYKVYEADGQLPAIWANTRAYLRYCARNAKWYNKMYPDTYLRKHTQDEWDKL